MKKLFKTIAAAALAVCTSVSMLTASAAETTFEDTEIFPANGVLYGITLPEGENTLTFNFTEVSSLAEGYYISVYKFAGNDGGYIFQFLGPIKMSEFTLTGLEGGHDYQINLSSTSNKQTVSGTVTTSYTGVSAQ